MIILEAAVENTNIMDKETNCRIAVSTSARKAFRTAWPEWSKVRNVILNRFIAELYSNSKTTQIFTPRTTGSQVTGQVGQVRDVGGGRFIAIMTKAQNWIKILTVKGSTPTLPALPPELKAGNAAAANPADPWANMPKTVN